VENFKELDFIKKNIIIKFHIELYERLYKKLEKFSNLNPDKYEELIICLIFRYSFIDSNNQQLAINKDIKQLFKNIGVNFELFGSAINVINDYYCSLFIDIEQYFGSKGNFFDIVIKRGIYWCNPPYINMVMSKAAKKIIKCLKKDLKVY
jgi:hypothetical protein